MTAEKRQRLQKAVDLCKQINNIIDLDVEVGGTAWRKLIRLRDDILREAGASENDIVQISHHIFLHGEPYDDIL